MQNLLPSTAATYLRDGHPRGFAWACKKYYSTLCYFAVAIIGNPNEAQRAVLNSLMHLWTERNKFQTPENIQVFLYYTTRNECFKKLRTNDNLIRVRKGDRFYDNSVELFLDLMETIEEAGAKNILESVFSIEFYNTEITFKHPNYESVIQ